ncbi:MAG: histidinol-phosphate transaminase [Acidimicrobiia bacterium]|nr:histidinol-phosphate transaminase [Acidimicrobiia bacterium]MYG57957.1 histidinol-phosphate transaminase [Acidimicrobiia bacterium]MYJ33076.1 histidinol-phosphate transaminase [Acidimicrobiia bacterium]
MSSPDRLPVRENLALMSGYHSPQLDVAVRLNTNESPVPPPEGWAEALRAAQADIDWHRYPDRGAHELRAALAKHEQVAPEQVFAANGSNEVLQCLMLAFGGPGRAALTFEPTYALHSHISRLAATEVVTGERNEDFSLDAGYAAAMVAEHRPAVTFLCSPNNPTGMVEPPQLVERLLADVSALPGLLLMDEAYGQFDPHTSVDLVDEGRPLAVTRTYSKTWSMAAARLGYLVGPSWLVAELEKSALPYHLDTMKQIAGRLALDYEDEMNERVAMLVSERERIAAALDQLPVRHWPSGANFMLLRPDSGDGDAVWQGLVDRSVLVRNCSSWPRLAGCLRVTVGSPAENDAFLSALSEVLT